MSWKIKTQFKIVTKAVMYIRIHSTLITIQRKLYLTKLTKADLISHISL